MSFEFLLFQLIDYLFYNKNNLKLKVENMRIIIIDKKKWQLSHTEIGIKEN